MKASKKRLIKFHEMHKKHMLENKRECDKSGHVCGEFETNGLGVSWIRCSRCGDRYNIQD